MARAILAGRPGSPGVATGRLLRVAPQAARAAANGRSAADPDGRRSPADEEARLRTALERAADQLDQLARQTAVRAGDDIGAIFEAQALFARDVGLVAPALAAIQAGQSAMAAIDGAAAQLAEQLSGVDDAYFRERAADVRDVSRRVSAILEDRSEPDLHHPDGSPAILAAIDLDASVVATLRPELVAGIALSGGAPNGHLAIVARALGLPVVLGLGEGLEAIVDGESAAVDGTRGSLLLDPSPAELIRLVETSPGDGRVATGPEHGLDLSIASSVNRLPVSIEANVGSVKEAQAAALAGASGVGLVRTELLFLGRSVAPGHEEQAALYRRIQNAMGGRPVVFRTLDVGGDKAAAYHETTGEPNPALGVRGIRMGLRQPGLLETQLAALVEAAAGQTLRVMFPMVSVREELEAARQVLGRVIARRRESGAELPAEVLVGIMVEVPAAALMADLLAPAVDFLSIGTNDLVQYTLASDRTNPALAELASPFQPAVLRLIASVTEAALAADRPVAVCGEAAADPLLAPLLVGLGVTELSVSPSAIALLRRALARVDPARCRELARKALTGPDVAAVKALATQLAGESGADIVAVEVAGVA
jgi:multiphosphoryl transfer protein